MLLKNKFKIFIEIKTTANKFYIKCSNSQLVNIKMCPLK